MKNLIKESFDFASGDDTSHYRCELLKKNIKVSDFVEAARRSSGGENFIFDEKFVDVILIVNNVEVVFFRMEYGDIISIEMIQHISTPRGSSKKTEAEILEKFGNCLVEECRWSGGWGSGRYALYIDYPIASLIKELDNVSEDLEDVLCFDPSKIVVFGKNATAIECELPQIATQYKSPHAVVVSVDDEKVLELKENSAII